MSKTGVRALPHPQSCENQPKCNVWVEEHTTEMILIKYDLEDPSFVHVDEAGVRPTTLVAQFPRVSRALRGGGSSPLAPGARSGRSGHLHPPPPPTAPWSGVLTTRAGRARACTRSC